MGVSNIVFTPDGIRRINITTQGKRPDMVRVQSNSGVTTVIMSAKRGMEFLEEVATFLVENEIEYMCYVTNQSDGKAQIDFVRRDDLISPTDGLRLIEPNPEPENALDAPEMPFNILYAIDVWEDIASGKIKPQRHDLFWKEEQILFESFHAILDANHNTTGNVAFETLDNNTHVVGDDEQITVLLKSGGQTI